MPKPSNEAVYYEALKIIAKKYMTPNQLQRRSQAAYGLPYEEALEYAYENIQSLAASAIGGKRKPQTITLANDAKKKGGKG